MRRVAVSYGPATLAPLPPKEALTRGLAWWRGLHRLRSGSATHPAAPRCATRAVASGLLPGASAASRLLASTTSSSDGPTHRSGGTTPLPSPFRQAIEE
jgi:hypothetical protein